MGEKDRGMVRTTRTMKITCVFYLCLLGCISCRSSVVYVSSSMGNDYNDGLTELTPVKTIKRGLLKADTVLLKAGDIFYEAIELKKGKLSRYGNGRPPKICGYKRIKHPQWELVKENVWSTCLIDNSYSGFHTAGSSSYNNVGCIHEFDNDSLHGHKVQLKDQLKSNWDIWQTERHGRKEVKPEDFDSLFLYLDRNPNNLHLELSVGTAAIIMQNASIENLKIEGFGFGVSVKSHTTIKHCEIDAIGGMTHLTDREFVNYGNGIEYWITGNLEDGLVEQNIISRCYDCGCTIQGRSGNPQNIVFRNNLIIDCCQGWEDFLSSEDTEMVFKDCVFEDNIVVNSGKTAGFGYPESRFKYCHVLGNNYKGNKGMIIRNNTFIGGNYYCSGAYNGKYESNVWQGNTCVIKRGDFILGNYMGTKDVIRVPIDKGEFRTLQEATDGAIARYRELTGDMTTKFIIKDEKYINKQIAKLKKKYLR